MILTQRFGPRFAPVDKSVPFGLKESDTLVDLHSPTAHRAKSGIKPPSPICVSDDEHDIKPMAAKYNGLM
jgi:hypothetical protein